MASEKKKAFKSPTLADIAKEANTTKPTVSKVLHGQCGTTRVSKKTRDRIMEIANRLGYQRNIAASQLSRGKTDAIGVVVGRFGSPFYGNLLTHLLTLLREQNYNLVPLLHEPQVTVMELSKAAVMQRQVDGVILLEYSREEQALEAQGFPIVARRWGVGSSHKATIPHALVNYQISFDRMIHRLASKNRKCIGLIIAGKNPTEVVKQNPKAKLFLNGLKKEKLACSEKQLCCITEHHEQQKMKQTYEKTLMLLQMNNKLDTLILDSGEMAVPVYKAARECGRTIGKDLALVAWSDTPEAPFLDPPLAVMCEPFDDVAQVLIQLLMKRLQSSNSTSSPASIEVPTYLIERESID